MAQNNQDVSLHGIHSPFEFLSQRGGIKLAFQGYCYVKEKKLKNGNTAFKCDFPNRQCNGRITIDDDNKVINCKEHNMHAPDQSSVEVKISKARYKETAADQPSAPLSALLNAEIARIPPAVRTDLPSDPAMKRSGQRVRRKDFPKEPTGPQEVVLEGNWCKVSGENWVIHQNSGEENPCIILGTKSNLRYLKQSKVWYGDGTFSVSPRLFYQLYTIHCPVMGKILPMVYCLLSNKTSVSYRQVFEILNVQMGGEVAVEKFRPDFEKAPIKQFMEVFPGRDIEACFFHFAQANWRQIQRLGLSEVYLSDFELKKLIKSFTAVAFVPPEDAYETFNVLKEKASETDALDGFVSYFEDTYIGKWVSRPDPEDPTRMQVKWKKPQYSSKLWSVYNRVLEGEPRTTGNLEAWHRRFGVVVNKHHPSIWQLLKNLQEEQIHTDAAISKLIAGQAPPKIRKDQQVKNTRLENVVSSYEEMKENIIEYLGGCSHNFDY